MNLREVCTIVAQTGGWMSVAVETLLDDGHPLVGASGQALLAQMKAARETLVTYASDEMTKAIFEAAGRKAKVR